MTTPQIYIDIILGLAGGFFGLSLLFGWLARRGTKPTPAALAAARARRRWLVGLLKMYVLPSAIIIAALSWVVMVF